MGEQYFQNKIILFCMNAYVELITQFRSGAISRHQSTLHNLAKPSLDNQHYIIQMWRNFVTPIYDNDDKKGKGG